MSKKKIVIDTDGLTPEQIASAQKQAHLIAHPRDTVLGVRLAKADIERWKSLAEGSGKYFVDFVEEALNEKAAKIKAGRTR